VAAFQIIDSFKSIEIDSSSQSLPLKWNGKFVNTKSVIGDNEIKIEITDTLKGKKRNLQIGLSNLAADLPKME